MSESEDQVSNQDDQTDDQQDASQVDDQQQVEEPISAAEAAKLRKDLADTRKEAAKHRTDLRKVQADAARAEQDKAKEAGNFQALYEAAQTTITERESRIVELEGQIAESDRATRRQTIAAKHRLTPELADRLRGDTDDELEADAKSLAKFVRTDAPDTEAGRGGRRPVAEQKPVTPGRTVEGVQKVAWTAGT